MGQEVEKSISSKCSNSQGYQELYQVLVEHSLHDGDHKNTKDSTERNKKD